jgi:uncharacterized protein YbgA (DUF1722 family)
MNFEGLPRPRRYTSMINVLMHALGYVSDGLEAAEKALFLDTLEKYRAGQVPLSVATMLLKSWAIQRRSAPLPFGQAGGHSPSVLPSCT